MKSPELVQGTRKVFIQHLDAMKPYAFLDLIKMIELDYDSSLSSLSLKITEKIDGSALRIGLNQGGEVFIESATSPSMFNVGDFEARDITKGYSGVIGHNFDYLLHMIKEDLELIGVLKKFSRGGIKVIGEILYTPFVNKWTPTTSTFVRIPYFNSMLGKHWTFIPIKVLEGNGNPYPGEECVMNSLYNISDSKRKYVSPYARLRSYIDLTDEIEYMNINIYGKYDNVHEILKSRKKADKTVKDALVAEIKFHQQGIAKKILSGVYKGILGPCIEGIVIEFPNGNIIKVISNEFKSLPSTL